MGFDNILCHNARSSPSRSYSDQGTATIGILNAYIYYIFTISILYPIKIEPNIIIKSAYIPIMAIKFVDNFSIEGDVILTLKPGILLGEAYDIARENMCNVLIKSYKGWELKREKEPVKVTNKFVTSYIIPDYAE